MILIEWFDSSSLWKVNLKQRRKLKTKRIHMEEAHELTLHIHQSSFRNEIIGDTHLYTHTRVSYWSRSITTSTTYNIS